MTFILTTPAELSAEYDDAQDVLYIWIGERPREALTYETDEGHLVRVDPHTHEMVGVTVIDYKARWVDEPIRLDYKFEIEQYEPWLGFGWFGRKRREIVRKERVLMPASFAHVHAEHA